MTTYNPPNVDFAFHDFRHGVTEPVNFKPGDYTIHDYWRGGVEFGIVSTDGRIFGVGADSVPSIVRVAAYARLCPKCRRPLIWCTCDDYNLAELDDYAATVDAASVRKQ